MHDSDLIAGCRRGDRDAQHEFYERTTDRVYALLLRMTGNADDALDLAQDAYIRAFQAIHTFHGQSALETWFYRIAVNEALQFLRRRRTAEKSRTMMSRMKTRIFGPLDDAGARLDLQDALSELRPTDRLMLLLRYQQGLDYRAIAEVTGCAAGTVASRLNRARGRLIERLGTAYAAVEETRLAKHP